jgi:hypothetical protein
MINSRLDEHEWKCAPSHWLPTKGRVPNACVGGCGNQVMSLEVGMGRTMRVCGMCRASLMILARVANN